MNFLCYTFKEIVTIQQKDYIANPTNATDIFSISLDLSTFKDLRISMSLDFR